MKKKYLVSFSFSDGRVNSGVVRCRPITEEMLKQEMKIALGLALEISERSIDQILSFSELAG